ncbi:hypothetical protein JEQ12_007892, partial [Ovis aries]
KFCSLIRTLKDQRKGAVRAEFSIKCSPNEKAELKRLVLFAVVLCIKGHQGFIRQTPCPQIKGILSSSIVLRPAVSLNHCSLQVDKMPACIPQPEWTPVIRAPTVSLYILVTLSRSSDLPVFSPPTWQGFEVNGHVLFSILNMVSNLVSHRKYLLSNIN